MDALDTAVALQEPAVDVPSRTQVQDAPTQVEALAAWVDRSTFDDLGAGARAALKRSVLDALGCAIGALGGRPPGFVRTVVDAAGGAPQCTLIGGGRTSLERATLCNGSLVRYLDFMDSFLTHGETCHPSDNLAPVLAASEYAERTGREFLHALAIAYEVQCRLAELGPLMASGFDHTTHLAFSVPAGVSTALGLDETRTAHAIAIGGCDLESLKVIRSSPGSHWKGIASASVSASAMTATLLAREGMEGPLHVFEGPGGLEELAGHRRHVDWTTPSLDRVRRTVLKAYNAEVHTQATIRAALCLREETSMRREDVSDIDGIEVETFLTAYEITGGGKLGDRHEVHSKEQADHSIPYLVAVALLDGEVTPSQFEPARIERSDVQELLRRVRVCTPSRLTRPRRVVEMFDSFTRHYPDHVKSRITLRRSGHEDRVVEVTDHDGFPTHPLTDEQVKEKFDSLAPDVDASLRGEIVGAVREVESLPRISELTSLLGRIRKS